LVYQRKNLCAINGTDLHRLLLAIKMNPILAKQKYKYHYEKKTESCVFCDVKDDRIIYETKHSIIIPKRQVINLEGLTKKGERLELYKEVNKTA